MTGQGNTQHRWKGAFIADKPTIGEKSSGNGANPFSPPGPAPFFFTTPEHRRRLKILERLILEGDPLVLVTGEKGAGKTTLLRRMEKRGNWRPCTILVQSGQSSKSQDPVNRRPALLARLDVDGRQRILAMDDAHLLKDNELLYVIQQSMSSQTMYRIRRVILLGEPGLPSRVRRLAANAEWELDYSEVKIPRLDAAETGDYLRRLWARRGDDAPFPFSQRQLDRLFAASEGIPGAAQTKAARLYEEKTGPAGLRGLVKTPLGKAVVLVSGALLLTVSAWMPKVAQGLFPQSWFAASPPPDTGGAPRQSLRPETAPGVDWIRKQPSSAWTIEVVRLFNPASVGRFQQMYRLDLTVAAYPAKSDGSFVVLAGVFPDKARAMAAVKGLSAKLPGYRLMIRSLGRIQAELP